ncbi:BTAD domain-containing putative transcriptional regulator [Streptomyces antimycoticus]
MDVAELSPLAVFALIATVTPGGATTLATASGAHFGFRRSAPLMAGIAVGLAAMAAAAAAGLGGVVLAVPWLQVVILAVEPERVDVHLMRALARQGRTASGEGDHRGAGQLHRRAAELRNGEALGSVGGDWAARSRAGLHQEHLGLPAELYEANCTSVGTRRSSPNWRGWWPAIGWTSAWPPSTSSPSAAVGAPADALTHYERTREQLAEELGTDPGPWLRE